MRRVTEEGQSSTLGGSPLDGRQFIATSSTSTFSNHGIAYLQLLLETSKDRRQFRLTEPEPFLLGGSVTVCWWSCQSVQVTRVWQPQ